MNKVNTLTIRFNNPIAFSQVPLLRGAIIHLLGEQAHVLFHNHVEDKFRYSYPLIQYKRIKGNAAIVCLGEGTEEIGRLFGKGAPIVQLGEQTMQLEIGSLKPQQVLIQVWDSVFRYRIRKWLPLNTENYAKYNQTDSVAERIILLENILTANLLSFAKGIGIHIDQKIMVNITDIGQPYPMTNKHVKLMAFDVEFKTNISLPDYVGIGKNASIGYGILSRVKETPAEQTEQ